jgi:hypothetical protein
VYCGARDTPKRQSISPAWRVCNQPACFAKILHDDVTMARLPELKQFRKKHKLRICTIQSLIAYRRLREKLIVREQW